MKRAQGGAIAGLMLPLRGWVSKFALALMILSAFVLMILSNSGSPAIDRGRAAVVDVITPVLSALSQPVRAAQQVAADVRGLALLHAENRRLRQDYERLLQWQQLARQLQVENIALRAQLNMVPDRRPRFVTARVVADTGGAFIRTILVSAGANDRVQRGQAVVSGEGLVGRISDVGSRSARVLLLTDINSRVPVLIESTGDRAILAGTNGERLAIEYLRRGAPVSAGDRVLTSGHGGVFPPGLLVGAVTQVSENDVTVEPLVDLSGLDFVRVLDYGPNGILPAPGEEATAPQ